MTTSEAAELLGVNASRVRQLRLEGRLQETRRIGGALIFKRADIEAFQAISRYAGRPRRAPPGEGDGGS